MTDRTYTQAEADALIAGARTPLIEALVEAVMPLEVLKLNMPNDYLTKDLQDAISSAVFKVRTVLTDDRALTPDAARLALEERENAKDAEIARLMAEVAIKIESFRAMAASEFELRQKVVASEDREKAIRALLLEGFNIVSSAYAHVSHGGPTREEALAWIKKVEKQLEGL